MAKAKSTKPSFEEMNELRAKRKMLMECQFEIQDIILAADNPNQITAMDVLDAIKQRHSNVHDKFEEYLEATGQRH